MRRRRYIKKEEKEKGKHNKTHHHSEIPINKNREDYSNLDITINPMTPSVNPQGPYYPQQPSYPPGPSYSPQGNPQPFYTPQGYPPGTSYAPQGYPSGPSYAQQGITPGFDVDSFFQRVATVINLDSDFSYNQIQICKICSTKFNAFFEIRALPCGHPYHKKCLFNSILNDRLNFCLICSANFS